MTRKNGSASDYAGVGDKCGEQWRLSRCEEENFGSHLLLAS